MQVARRFGSRVIGTAGSDRKSDFVAQQGTCHVFDSRSPEFRQRVLDVTGGKGADVVLNSLSGDLLSEGLQTLAPFGRFVEIGKADIQQNRELGLGTLSQNRSYHALDVDEWLLLRGGDVQRILAETVAQIEAGELTALPVTTFPPVQLSGALRFLAQARHIGKVVIDMVPANRGDAIHVRSTTIRSDGVYVISGGTRGYGLGTATWLAEQGARTVALLSRSGAVEREEEVSLRRMEELGVTVIVRRCDVTSFDEVASVFADLKQYGQVRGIVHAATVLDDGPIGTLTAEQFRNVAAPKALGAWNLHLASRECSLDFFLMFSSISSALGTPGQANYAAGNAFLDSFATYLRRKNIPAFAINWGVLDDMGLVARAPEEQRRKILSQGIGAFHRPEAMDILESVLAGNLPNVIAARIDWKSLDHRDGKRRFPWIDRFAGKEQSPAATPLRDQIRGAPADQKCALLVDAILQQVSKILGIERARLDADTAFDRIGIDSLSAVQLTSWLEAMVGASVPVMQILGGSSARRLSATLACRAVLKSDHGAVERDSFGRVLKSFTSARSTKPALRIFGFPYSGGTSDAFAAWARFAPANVEIYGIELPAIEDENSAILREPLGLLYQWIYRALAPLLDVPFAFYGHSVGGWHALGITRVIAEHDPSKMPATIGVGGLPTPEFLDSFTPKNLAHPREVSDEYVLKALKAWQVQRNGSHTSEAARQAFELVRRDLWLGTRTDVCQFAVPEGIRSLLVFGGSGDPLPTIDKAPGQFIPATVSAEVNMVDGGHLFINDPRVQAEVLNRIIAAAKNGADSPPSGEPI
jgi:surfactin synthase thioesterase subunit/NAD(P)-dependent dehydrogenase (short-subunit alcohol dehydrogenase family)